MRKYMNQLFPPNTPHYTMYIKITFFLEKLGSESQNDSVIYRHLLDKDLNITFKFLPVMLIYNIELS